MRYHLRKGSFEGWFRHNPKNMKSMKKPSMLIVGGAFMLAMVPVWTSGITAGAQDGAAALVSGGSLAGSPLNRACVVTVDTRGAPKTEFAGAGNMISGFSAPDTVEGILIGLDSEWLVLREDGEENWIPRNKILLLRVGR
jgi:hypothetical protein